MNEFTAQDAREIVASESYSTKGFVIDQIKKAARNGQHSVSIPNLKLLTRDKEYFENNGFTIDNKNISWKETQKDV